MVSVSSPAKMFQPSLGFSIWWSHATQTVHFFLFASLEAKWQCHSVLNFSVCCKIFSGQNKKRCKNIFKKIKRKVTFFSFLCCNFYLREEFISRHQTSEEKETFSEYNKRDKLRHLGITSWIPKGPSNGSQRCFQRVLDSTGGHAPSERPSGGCFWSYLRVSLSGAVSYQSSPSGAKKWKVEEVSS